MWFKSGSYYQGIPHLQWDIQCLEFYGGSFEKEKYIGFSGDGISHQNGI